VKTAKLLLRHREVAKLQQQKHLKHMGCSSNYRLTCNTFEGIAEPVCENFLCSVPPEKIFTNTRGSISGPLDFVHPRL